MREYKVQGRYNDNREPIYCHPSLLIDESSNYEERPIYKLSRENPKGKHLKMNPVEERVFYARLHDGRTDYINNYYARLGDYMV